MAMPPPGLPAALPRGVGQVVTTVTFENRCLGRGKGQQCRERGVAYAMPRTFSGHMQATQTLATKVKAGKGDGPRNWTPCSPLQ